MLYFLGLIADFVSSACFLSNKLSNALLCTSAGINVYRIEDLKIKQIVSSSILPYLHLTVIVVGLHLSCYDDDDDDEKENWNHDYARCQSL